MEKRTSPVELRLGFSLDWKIKYFTATKYYLDSTRMLLFILYFLNGLQKHINYTIPTSFIKVFITNKAVFINFSYIPLLKKRILLETARPSIVEDIQLDDENAGYYSDKTEVSMKKFYSNCLLINKKKKIAKIKFKSILLHYLISTKKIKEKKFNKSLIILNLKTLNTKLYEQTLNELFMLLTNKASYVTTVNIKQTLSKNPEALYKNFYEIKEWYKKVGGNLYNFKTNLLTTYFTVTYKNCIPLFLTMIKESVETQLNKQKIMMSTAYNLLFAYTWVQRNIEGLRITFKGTIGNHGRAKSLTFLMGSLYQSSLVRPLEYYYIKMDTKYGSIGMRLWILFNEIK